jgi:hypothetical protein
MTGLVTPAAAENLPSFPIIKITEPNKFSVAQVLEDNIGKQIEVTVSTGAVFRGKLAGIGAQAIHLQGLSGREFYDAVIGKESIVAVVLQVRNN